MNQELLDFIENQAVKLSHNLYGMIYNGKMIIIEKTKEFGWVNYRSLVSFTFDEFDKLVEMSEYAKEELSQKIMSEQITE